MLSGKGFHWLNPVKAFYDLTPLFVKILVACGFQRFFTKKKSHKKNFVAIKNRLYLLQLKNSKKKYHEQS